MICIRSIALPMLALVAACGTGLTQAKTATTADLKTTAPQTAGTKGQVSAVEGPSGNTDVDLRVEHLADPAAVAPGARTYVVWARSRSGPGQGAGPMQNLGAFVPDKNESGELRTITPLKSFDLMITPESNSETSRPTHSPVLQTSVSR
jgi:hypothetical protein